MYRKREIAKELLQIVSTLPGIKLEHSKLQPIIFGDLFRSLPIAQKLVAMLYDNNIEDRFVVMLAEDFLRERWDRIKQTPLCYSVNTTYSMNLFCCKLCELMVGKVKNSLLMPTVLSSDNFFGEDFDELEFGSFILTDDAKQFISIHEWVKYTMTFMMNNGQLVLAVHDTAGHPRAISQAESVKLSAYISQIKRIFEILPRSAILIKLQDLYRGLKNGDVSHSGTEDNPAPCAYDAIARFFEYYNYLPYQVKNQIVEYRHNSSRLGDLLDRLERNDFETYEGTGLRSCIKIISIELNFIIESNQAAIRNLPSNLNKDKLIQSVLEVSISVDQRLSIIRQLELIIPQYHYIDCCGIDLSLGGYQYHRSNELHIYALLSNFVCDELDRLTSSADVGLGEKKIKLYLITLFMLFKESCHFADRPHDIQKQILNEIVDRITVITEIKRTSYLIGIFMKTTSKSHLDNLISNNRIYFDQAQIKVSLSPIKRKELEAEFLDEISRLDLATFQSHTYSYLEQFKTIDSGASCVQENEIEDILSMYPRSII